MKYFSKKFRAYLTNFWLEYYANKGLCSLCGNSGRIDTTTAVSAAGVKSGCINYCICPNGQVLREANTDPNYKPDFFRQQ